MAMDFVFGTYVSDALKLANHRAARHGVQHRNHISPSDPTPGDPVTVSLVTAGIGPVDGAALYYTTDESTPLGTRGTATQGRAIAFRKTRTEWDSLVWDYLTHWQAEIPPQPEGTLVRYAISAWAEDGDELYADWPDARERVRHEAMIFFENIPPDAVFTPGDPASGRVFGYHVDTVRPPAWAAEAVIYQISIDRFHPGEGRSWRQTDDLGGICGGTLWGVRDKLDYLADLGVDCLWLGPPWTSPSHHGYDVADYDRIEPRLGGEEALRAVVEGAHRRGIRVLLDMACNHLSNEHPLFLEARTDEASPYRSWFHFDAALEHGYRGFFNVATMPELDLAHPAARDWMIANAVRWLQEFDIDGYRLDYANGPGPDFWTYFRRACKAARPDCLLFGEVIEPPSELRRYHGRLDGCLDFPLNDALRRSFGWRSWDEAQFSAFLESHQSYFPDGFVMPSFIDSHDMDRFLFIAGNDGARLRKAVAAQLTARQPAVIYYGTEVGLRQTVGTRTAGLEASRVPMVWGEGQDRELLAFFRERIRARKRRAAAAPRPHGGRP